MRTMIVDWAMKSQNHLIRFGQYKEEGTLAVNPFEVEAIVY